FTRLSMRCAAGADSWADHPRASSLREGGQYENIDVCGVGTDVRNGFGSRARNVRKQSGREKRQAARGRGKKQLHGKMQTRGVHAQGNWNKRQGTERRGEEKLHGKMSEGASLILLLADCLLSGLAPVEFDSNAVEVFSEADGGRTTPGRIAS